MKYLARFIMSCLFMYKTTLTISRTVLQKEDTDINEIEIKILYCISQGLRLKQVAETQNLSKGAIKQHMAMLYKKTKVKLHTPAALVGWMAEHQVYFKIKRMVIKTKLGEKVERLKKMATYILFIFIHFLCN